MNLTKRAFNGKNPILLGEWISNGHWSVLISMLENKALWASAPIIEASFKLAEGDVRSNSMLIKDLIDKETNNGTRVSYALTPTGWVKQVIGAGVDLVEYAGEKGERIYLDRAYVVALELGGGRPVYQYRAGGPVFNAAVAADAWILLMPAQAPESDNVGARPLVPELMGDIDAAHVIALGIEKAGEGVVA